MNNLEKGKRLYKVRTYPELEKVPGNMLYPMQLCVLFSKIGCTMHALLGNFYGQSLTYVGHIKP